MGYACPVCAAEQADAVHLANHLAVTASLGRENHLEWLETYAPDWGECGPEELGERVSEHVSETETPEFETDHGSKPTLEEELARQTSGAGRGDLTGRGDSGELTSESLRVLEEAQELTRRMHGADDDSDSESANDGSSDRESADDGSSDNASADGAGSNENA